MLGAEVSPAMMPAEVDEASFAEIETSLAYRERR